MANNSDSPVHTSKLGQGAFSVPGVTELGKSKKQAVQGEVTRYVGNYLDSHAEEGKQTQREPTLKNRREHAKDVATNFYSLVTDFYEYGYGHSFHFAPIYDGKSLPECVAIYEQGVAKLLKAKPGMKLLDVGCGVGGPGREIARFSGASVVGLNCSDYQLERAREHTRKAGLQDLCTYVKGDFCHMEFEDNTFDGIFCFEATCHAGRLADVYKEIARVLKPGGVFVDCAWVVTDSYDPQNPEHVKVHDDIVYGNALPELRTQKETIDTMREVGLDVVEFKDCVREGDWNWYSFMEGRGCSLQSFRVSTIGRMVTHCVLTVLETLSIAPKGVTKVHSVLQVAASSLIKSGRMEIFTPMFRVVGRKPDQE